MDWILSAVAARGRFAGFRLLVATLLLVWAQTVAGVVAQEPLPAFEVAPCPFETPVSGEDISLECGYLSVPESRSGAGERTIRLAVARFRPAGGTVAADPVVFLQGGPGGSVLETLAFGFAPHFEAVVASGRELILFDQRGVGLSEPALDCPAFRDLYLDLLDFETDGVRLTGPERLERKLAALEACAADLREVADLSAYHTAENAADVEALRRALGYEVVNLWGGSYGSRLALEALRRFPEGLRSVVLEAVYPPDGDLFLETPGDFARSLETLFADCASEPACSAAYPRLEERFFETVTRLGAEPALVEVLHPLTRERVPLRISGDVLLELVFRTLYATELRAYLPRIMAAAGEDTFDLLLLAANEDLLRQELRSWGMYLSTLCHDEIPFGSWDAFVAELDAHPAFEGFFLGFEVGGLTYGICPAWGAGVADAVIDAPVTSDVPVLLLAGESDPIAPPAWARRVAATLPRGYLFSYPGVGHGLSGQPCARQMLVAFLDDPTIPPEDRCRDQLAVPPFALPETAAQAVSLEPFVNREMGLRGVRPAGWSEVAPGAFARSASAVDAVALTVQAAPLEPDVLLASIRQRLDLPAPPEVAVELQVGGLAWRLYEAEVQGLAVDLAIAEREGGIFLVVLQGPLTERDELYRTAFLPAIEALEPLADEADAPAGTAEPGGAEAPEASVALVPFSSDTFGIRGLVPEGWQRAAPGVYVRDDVTRLIQQAAPGMDRERLCELLCLQLGLEAFPEPLEVLRTDAFRWDLSLVEVEAPALGPVRIDLAMAETAGKTYLILLQTTETDYQALHEEVFVPAVRALTPLVAEEPEDDAEGIYREPEGRFSVPVPGGWRVEQFDGYAALVSPDDEVTVYVLALQAPDFESGVREAWALIDPGFALEPDRVIDEPVTNGAERAVTLLYDTGDEGPVILAGGWQHGGIAYIEIARAELESFQKRYFQFQIINTGYAIAALEETDLSGRDPRPLAEVLDAFRTYVQEKMAQFEVPGAAIAIVQGGETVYAEGFGVRDLAGGEPVTPETMMMVGSSTKSLTTLLMAQLVDEGVFAWDTPVIEVYPGFRVSDPEVTRRITMRDLVCACSGVPRRDFEWLFNAAELDAESIIASLADFEFFTEFGEAFQYSNQMVAAGGYLAALAATGRYGELYDAYLELLQSRVLDPIGMDASTFSFAEVLAGADVATPYGVTMTGDMVPLPLGVEEVLVPIGPAGALWSNVGDMAAYLATLLARGVTPDGVRIVSAENLAQTWEPQVAVTADVGYGLGWLIEDYHGITVIRHGGNTFGFTSELAFVPELDLGISVLVNQRISGLGAVAWARLLELLFDREPEVEAMVAFQHDMLEERYAEVAADLLGVEPEEVAPYLGRYRHQALGEVRLIFEDGVLLLDAGEFRIEVRAFRKDGGEVRYATFTTPLEGVPVAFDLAEDGSPVLTLGLGVVEYPFTRPE